MPAWMTSLLRAEVMLPVSDSASSTITSRPESARRRAIASPTTAKTIFPRPAFERDCQSRESAPEQARKGICPDAGGAAGAVDLGQGGHRGWGQVQAPDAAVGRVGPALHQPARRQAVDQPAHSGGQETECQARPDQFVVAGREPPRRLRVVRGDELRLSAGLPPLTELDTAAR
mgnify:CR=1 FL=1